MGISLRWQILWPGATLLLFGALLVATHVVDRNQVNLRLQALLTLRESIERTVSNLEERHIRAMRHLQTAINEQQNTGAPALQVWSRENYATDMQSLVETAHTVVKTAHVPHADPRLSLDLPRLDRQLDRIAQTINESTIKIDAHLENVASEEPDLILPDHSEIGRIDTEILTQIHVADALLRRLTTWQLRNAGNPIVTLHPFFWLAFVFWIPTALWLTLRPLQRLQRLGATSLADTPTLAPSREEKRIADQFQALTQRLTSTDALLTERNRDVDRQQQTLRRLEHELAEFRIYNDNLINSLRTSIVITDTNSTLTTFNRSARQLFDLGDKFVGQKLSQHELYKSLTQRTSDAQKSIDQALTERQALRYEAIPYKQKVLDLTISPYQDESGAARGIIWAADDITEATATKHQLLASERLAAVGRLSAQVAHEIRNPLSAIGLNAELLEEEFVDGLPPGPRQQEAAQLLRAISDEVTRLSDVTEGYLHLARMPHPLRREADINQLIADLFVMLGEEMKSHHIDVRFKFCEPAPRCFVDPGQIRQALINIVRNSREAMPDGGSLTVTTYQGSDCIITVADSGPGIPEDVRSRVFEPFFTTKHNGTGLGLSLTHQIITEHQGDICITTAEPHGTAVILRLPKGQATAFSELDTAD